MHAQNPFYVSWFWSPVQSFLLWWDRFCTIDPFGKNNYGDFAAGCWNKPGLRPVPACIQLIRFGGRMGASSSASCSFTGIIFCLRMPLRMAAFSGMMKSPSPAGMRATLVISNASSLPFTRKDFLQPGLILWQFCGNSNNRPPRLVRLFPVLSIVAENFTMQQLYYV